VIKNSNKKMRKYNKTLSQKNKKGLGRKLKKGNKKRTEN
jgi:hypothetical protein